VLLRTEDQAPRRIWERRLNLRPGELHDLVFQGETSREATIGRASTDDIWRAIGDRLELSETLLAELQTDFWAGDRLDQELVEITRSLRQNLKTALLSNAWPDLRAYLTEELAIADAFDLLVISAEEGTAKPDKQIYQVLLERLGTQPQECVFIDDREDNVLAAADLGMHSILFLDREQVLGELGGLLPEHLSELISS
jgi:putative hydrolase of the HAD superfamily